MSRRRQLSNSNFAHEGPNTLVEIALFLHVFGTVKMKTRAFVVYTQALMLAPLNLHAIWGLAMYIFVFGTDEQQEKFHELVQLGHKSDGGLANLDFLMNFCFKGGAAIQHECPETLCSLAALQALIEPESVQVAVLLKSAYKLWKACPKANGTRQQGSKGTDLDDGGGHVVMKTIKRVNHMISRRYGAATKAQGFWRRCIVRLRIQPLLRTGMNLWRYTKNPEDLESMMHHAFSVLCFKLHFDHAKDLFTRFLGQDPQNALALFGLGTASIFTSPDEQGEKESALQALLEAQNLEFLPDTIMLYAEIFFDPTRHKIWLDAEPSWQRRSLHLCVCAIFSQWALADVSFHFA